MVGDRRRGVITAPLAVALGVVPVLLLDLVIVGRRVESGGLAVRLEHLAYIVGYRALVALLLAGVALLVMRLFNGEGSRTRRWTAASVLLVLTSVAFGSVAFADDFYSYPLPKRAALTVGLSLLPAAFVTLRVIAGWIAARFTGRGLAVAIALRVPFVIVGGLAALANHIVLPYGNPGPHIGMLLVASVGFGMAIVGLPVRARPRARRLALAVCTVWAAWSVVARPSSGASLALARNEAAAVYPFVVSLWPDHSDAGFAEQPCDPVWLAEVAGDPSWFARTVSDSSVPASRPLVDPARAIVVLITFDSFRNDVFMQPQYAATTPTLQALRGESTVFTAAHTTSSSTAPSIASIFSGRYLSELYWTKVPYAKGTRFRYFPTEDPTSRVPELLPDSIHSFTVPSIERLHQEYALIRGFTGEAPTDTREDLLAAEVLPPLAAWLSRNGDGPAFAFTHVMDAHSPYDTGGTRGTVFDRHVRELGRADAQLAEFIRTLEAAGLWSRTVLIIAADYGEAFGEHAQTQHGGSLHEELTRIPMLIRVPGRVAREVSEPVSLIDLGPTILDMFQQATPAVFRGQSLVPLMAGDKRRLTRPVALESTRLHRAMIFRDGFKVIWRTRENQFELHYLKTDPGELYNILEREPSAGARVNAVRSFFRAHELVRPGYAAPHYW